jgi:glycosyltransferase involved in cell wall biosynthesis
VSAGPTPILYLAPWVDLGGSDKGTIDWFKAIDRERWRPSLITTQPSPNRWLHLVEPFAAEIWDLPDLMPGGSFPSFILGFIASRGVRVVHVMNARLGLDLLPDIARLPEPPAVVVQMHAEEPDEAGYVRYAARRYANLIDAFSVTSEQLAEVVAGYDVPPSRIETIASGVDAAGEFDPAAVAPMVPAGAVPRILWPGRLTEQKDPMLTLEVVAAARERGADFALDVVGDGPLKAEAQRRAAELGVADAIEWHPASQEMPRWYRGADLMLMTSRYEGVPYAMYEALAMGVPVVVPALPGNVEFMDADGGAVIEPRDDVGAYAEAIVALLGDDERRRELGRRSRQRMLAEFSLEEMARRHGELYERLLERRGGAGERPAAATDAKRPAAPASPADPEPLRLARDPRPEPTVGVIVPCYRHGIFLAGCIDSIKAQTHPAARIVVVDDGSEDVETVAALARLDDDPAVTVLRQPANRGPSAARNRGLAELDTGYVLPIDADDELLPDALERMLARLEAAPADVGFVYPNIQYMGNRDDYVASPAYNLWLLMAQNYCPAPALFDRRLFAAGVAYAEEIVLGHEDWDLVLQIAELGVVGVPADGPTFRYRQQGFSRANAVDDEPEAFDRAVAARHPALYGDREAIKARWAPALSILLLDEEGGAWEAGDLAGLAAQTCGDFELLAASAGLDGATTVDAGGDPVAWLGAAIHRARGRWVLLLPRSAAAALADPTFVEALLRTFLANERVVAAVLADAPGAPRHRFAQLDDRERLAAEPAAVAFERPSWGRIPDVGLSPEGPPLADLVVGLQDRGVVEWRYAPVGVPAAPWRRLPGGTSGAEGPLDLNLAPGDGPAAAAAAKALYAPPLLPGEAPVAGRRAVGSARPWAPPQSRPLCRHRDPVSGARVLTPSPEPPTGYELECVLGAVHEFPLPGTKRLIHRGGGFVLAAARDALEDGDGELGYVEDQPLPMLLSLDLRRAADSGQETLVASAGDPLAYGSERLATLGWIEAQPILPFAAEILHAGLWDTVSLQRRIDLGDWRHRYSAESPTAAVGGVSLGLLQRRPTPRHLALRLRSDGRLASEFCAPGSDSRASRDPRKLGRWLAEPIAFGGDSASPRKDAAARLRHLATGAGSRRPAAEEEGVVLGYLRRENGPGSSTLYSTVHPVTGDQLVTRSPAAAEAQGYVLAGILGSIVDPLDGDGGEAEATASAPLPWGRLPRPG